MDVREEDAAGAEGTHGHGDAAADEVGEGFEIGTAGDTALSAGDRKSVLLEVPDCGIGELIAIEEFATSFVGEELLVAFDLGRSSDELGNQFRVVVRSIAHRCRECVNGVESQDQGLKFGDSGMHRVLANDEYRSVS